MRASELIAKLQALVAEHGDLPVQASNYSDEPDYDVRYVGYARGWNVPFLGRQEPDRFILGDDDAPF